MQTIEVPASEDEVVRMAVASPGGCPLALNATGNTVTEGIPGEPLYGDLPDAGVTKGFVPATGRA